MHDVHNLMKAVLKIRLHALTQDWTSHVLSLIKKVRTCDLFTICTLVDLPLSVISTSELVLFASKWAPLTLFAAYQLSLFCLLACQHIGLVHFVCQHIGSVHFVCEHIGLVHFVCQHNGSVHFVCQHKSCSRLSSPWEILRGGQMEVKNQNLKTSRLRTFATGSPVKNSMRNYYY